MLSSLRSQSDKVEVSMSNNEPAWLGGYMKDLTNKSQPKKGSCLAEELSTPIYDNGKMVLPPAVADPDKVSPEEVDAFLTNELTRMSMDERDQIAQELHCITEPIQEEPTFVSKCLSDLQHELKMLPSADMTAYRKAHTIDPTYTTDRSFRLQFLRAERFNPKAAASRLARYFHEKFHLFGPEKVRFLICSVLLFTSTFHIMLIHLFCLVSIRWNMKVARSITLADLSADETSTLTSGFVQSCPSRDRSGRAILLAFPALEKFKDLTSLVCECSLCGVLVSSVSTFSQLYYQLYYRFLGLSYGNARYDRYIRRGPFFTFCLQC